MVHKHRQHKFVVCPQFMNYDSTKHFVRKYPLLSFLNHMDINPKFFVFALVQVSSLWIDRLTRVDHTMTQTQHVLNPQLFFLSPRYKLTNIALVASLQKMSSFLTQ